MKITTWNINGYRAIEKKGFREWVKRDDPDILCLQEIKVKPEQLSEEQKQLYDYRVLWNSAEKPGYSGVATFFKKDPLESVLGMERMEFDTEGRVIRVRYPGFFLYNIYFPNGQRGQDRVDYKLAFYKHLLDHVDELMKQGEQVIITGDFNTAHREIDLAHPKENKDTSGFLMVEREMIDTYIQHGLVDIFRTLYPERIAYTWWTYITNARAKNVGWRIDYFMITPGLVNRVKDMLIQDDVLGSDHCPVTLILDD